MDGIAKREMRHNGGTFAKGDRVSLPDDVFGDLERLGFVERASFPLPFSAPAKTKAPKPNPIA